MRSGYLSTLTTCPRLLVHATARRVMIVIDLAASKETFDSSTSAHEAVMAAVRAAYPGSTTQTL